MSKKGKTVLAHKVFLCVPLISLFLLHFSCLFRSIISHIYLCLPRYLFPLTATVNKEESDFPQALKESLTQHSHNHFRPGCLGQHLHWDLPALLPAKSQSWVKKKNCNGETNKLKSDRGRVTTMIISQPCHSQLMSSNQSGAVQSQRCITCVIHKRPQNFQHWFGHYLKLSKCIHKPLNNKKHIA